MWQVRLRTAESVYYYTILLLLACSPCDVRVCVIDVKKRSNKTNKRQKNVKNVTKIKQEAQLSPSDRAMRLVSSNFANCHATVQKLLIRQVLTKLMV